MSANNSENDLPPWVPPTPSGTANSPGKAVNVPNTPAEEVEKVAPPTVIANKRNANVVANANGNAGANNNDGVARALSFANEEETGDQSNEPQDGGSRKRRARKSKSKKAKKSRKAKSKKSKKNVRRN
jgi:hypothetical protein